MSEAAFVILDLADMDAWATPHGRPIIPPAKRATVLQLERKQAEEELLRLGKAHPSGRFVLFEARAVATRVQCATHVNLHGVAVLTESVVRLAKLATDDDEIPF